MKKRIAKISLLLLCTTLLLVVACKQQPTEVITKTDPRLNHDQVHQNILPEIRLGDGVPLYLNISIRWKITDGPLFFEQFASIDSFNLLILKPRAFEISRRASNGFSSIDSVFSSQRNEYITTIKQNLMKNLGEPGIDIREIILSEVGFPNTYTQSMEEAGLKQRELERIRLQNIVDIEQAEANKLKTEADAKVAVAKAEADGRLQKINAKMEESRRKSELAKAETQTQVEKLKVAAEAEKRKIMAKAELEKTKDLQDLEIQRQKAFDRLVIEKKRELEEVEFTQQNRFARICSDNPVYATYLVNKELASKVEVAFLPTGPEANIFTNLLKDRMPLPGTRE